MPADDEALPSDFRTWKHLHLEGVERHSGVKALVHRGNDLVAYMRSGPARKREQHGGDDSKQERGDEEVTARMAHGFEPQTHHEPRRFGKSVSATPLANFGNR